MDPSSDIFNVIECIIPDLNQWNFRFENSNPVQISTWLKEEDNGEDDILFVCRGKEEDQPILPFLRTADRTSDFEVFNEFFPSISLPSNSSASSNNYENVPPPPFYAQNSPPQWPNSYQHSHLPLMDSHISVSNPRNNRLKDGESPGECSHCRTRESTMWRFNAKTGERECNACKLYEERNNRKRPQSLWKNTILKRRNRNRKQKQ